MKLTSLVISKLEEIDTTKMFAQPVTKIVAKNYFDVIRNPMDLFTMSNKSKRFVLDDLLYLDEYLLCNRGQYKSLQALRQDFELMCLNALVYNKKGLTCRLINSYLSIDDEYWVEAKTVFLKGTRGFENQNRKSHCSAYGAEVNGILGTQQESFEVPREKEKKRKIDQQLIKKSKKMDKYIKRKKSRNNSLEFANQDDVVDINNSNLICKEKEEKTHWRKKRVSSLEVATDHHVKDENIGDESINQVIDVKEEKCETSETNKGSADNDSMDNPIPNKAVIEDIILPTQLIDSTDPQSCLLGNIVIQTIEEGFYTSHQDVCFLCGSAGSSDCLLFCCDCGEAYHSFCAEAPISNMKSEYQINSWRCMNCKVCVLCGKTCKYTRYITNCHFFIRGIG